MRLIGVLLVVLGGAVLGYDGIVYQADRSQPGDRFVSRPDDPARAWVGPVLGGLAVVGGVALVAGDRRSA